MGIIDVLPMSIRIALLYSKAAKIAKTDKSHDEKLKLIRKKENFWKGKSGFHPEIVGAKQSLYVSIGLKDMAKIYNSIQAPNNAIRCVNTIGNSLIDYLKALPKDESFSRKRHLAFESQVWAWLHKATAYAMKNTIDKCRELLDNTNQAINTQIELEPANKRLADIYDYTISRTYSTFLQIADDFPNNALKARLTCLYLLQKFQNRDPNNDLIQEYINQFTKEELEACDREFSIDRMYDGMMKSLLETESQYLNTYDLMKMYNADCPSDANLVVKKSSNGKRIVLLLLLIILGVIFLPKLIRGLHSLYTTKLSCHTTEVMQNPIFTTDEYDKQLTFLDSVLLTTKRQKCKDELLVYYADIESLNDIVDTLHYQFAKPKKGRTLVEKSIRSKNMEEIRRIDSLISKGELLAPNDESIKRFRKDFDKWKKKYKIPNQ